MDTVKLGLKDTQNLQDNQGLTRSELRADRKPGKRPTLQVSQRTNITHARPVNRYVPFSAQGYDGHLTHGSSGEIEIDPGEQIA